MELVFSFHWIIFDYNQSSIKPCDMIDYEKSNNQTTLGISFLTKKKKKKKKKNEKGPIKNI